MCYIFDVQRAVHKIGSAFENEAKAPGALMTLINLKDNHIFRGLRTLITPGALAMLVCGFTFDSRHPWRADGRQCPPKPCQTPITPIGNMSSCRHKQDCVPGSGEGCGAACWQPRHGRRHGCSPVPPPHAQPAGSGAHLGTAQPCADGESLIVVVQMADTGCNPDECIQFDQWRSSPGWKALVLMVTVSMPMCRGVATGHCGLTAGVGRGDRSVPDGDAAAPGGCSNLGAKAVRQAGRCCGQAVHKRGTCGGGSRFSHPGCSWPCHRRGKGRRYEGWLVLDIATSQILCCCNV
jgi:hypothetical protein